MLVTASILASSIVITNPAQSPSSCYIQRSLITPCKNALWLVIPTSSFGFGKKSSLELSTRTGF